MDQKLLYRREGVMNNDDINEFTDDVPIISDRNREISELEKEYVLNERA